MMRKTSLVFLGAMAGAVVTLLATQPHALLIGSAARAADGNFAFQDQDEVFGGLALFKDDFACFGSNLLATAGQPLAVRGGQALQGDDFFQRRHDDRHARLF